MRSFDEHFSDDSILWELCKARAKLAKSRHDRLFLHRISKDSPSAEFTRKDLEGMFPSRRVWNRFRPRERAGQSSFALNVVSLFRAVKRLRQETPGAPWVAALARTIETIQFRALEDKGFQFAPPKIFPQRKTPNGHEYRPLAVFPLQEKIIDSLTAKYLRQIVEEALLPSCLAFRCVRDDKQPPTIHDALEKIVRVNKRNRKTGLYVAECDIKSFFDCVSHDVARQAVGRLLEEATTTTPASVSDRALLIFEKFLASYAFERSIAQSATKALRRRDPGGVFKWPVDDLRILHSSGSLAEIGVPQGGALSCLIANAVLHLADQRQAQLARKLKKSITYLRYCDDMILLSRDEDACKLAFALYNQTLKEIRLPAHAAKNVGVYAKDFWEGKSNAPYYWNKPSNGRGVPWIQFVGFQVRHDGLIRVRPKSLKKQRQRITLATDSLLAALNPGRQKRGELTPFAKGIRKRKRQITHRFHQQLLSISVGRRKLGQVIEDPMPMCWANGFRGLRSRKLVRGMFVSLDRHRERQFKRITRRLKTFPLARAVEKQNTPTERFYGHPFSYFGQFCQ
jgi:hypothetical protein